MRALKILCLCGSVFFACTNTNNKVSENTPINQLPEKDLKTAYKAHLDSITSNWDTINKIENEKIALIKRLIDEVTYNPKHNPSETDLLLEGLEKVKAERLTQENISVSTNIDKYDALCDSLIKQVSFITKNTPDMNNYPLHEELLMEINELNTSSTLRTRITYSDIVERYNEFVANYKENLEANGIENTAVKPNFYVSD